MIVLSCYTVQAMLEGRAEGATAATASLDLGVSDSLVMLSESGVTFPGGESLGWGAIREIADTPAACFAVAAGRAERIQFFSERLNRFYSLMPTPRAPTMLLSGIPMHRIKDVDPHEDTMRKIRTIGPVVGAVLDTCTGLGYTAIAAARTADSVLTVELDPTVLEVARRNPWSRELFGNPRIEQRIGDSAEVIAGLPDSHYSRIFHDPPTMSIAGDLYSTEVYRHLYRLLRRGGRLYHYTGDLDSTTGRVVAKGVVRRLQDVGFERVTRRPEAFGIVGQK